MGRPFWKSGGCCRSILIPPVFEMRCSTIIYGCNVLMSTYFWSYCVCTRARDLMQRPTMPHVASCICDNAYIKPSPLCSWICCCTYTSALCHWGVTQRWRVPDEMTWKHDSAPGQQRMWREYVNLPGSRGYLVFVRWMKFSPLFSSFPLSHLCD